MFWGHLLGVHHTDIYDGTENGSNNNSDNKTCIDGSIVGGTRDTSTGNNNVMNLIGTYQTIA